MDEKKLKQREANQRYIKSIPDFYKKVYDRIKNNPEQMEKRKMNNKQYYDKNREKILAKMKTAYYEKRDIVEFNDEPIL